MKANKLFGIFSVTIAAICLILIVIFFINQTSTKCKETHVYYNTTKECYYYSNICQKNEGSKIIESQNACVYPTLGIRANDTISIILIILGVIWLIAFGIFLYSILTKKPSLLKTIVTPDKAKELVLKNIAKRENLPTMDGIPKFTSYRLFGDKEPYPKSNEWFFQFELELLEGDHPGVITINVPLSRGEERISNGDFREQRGHYDEFKIPSHRPLVQSQDASERLLESLAQTHPERAAELQQQMIEKKVTTATTHPEPETPTEEQQPQQPQYMPAYRRRPVMRRKYRY